MAQVFVSYAQSDRDRVAPLARSLEDLGWSVWWDRHIPVGRTFDEVVEHELDAASAVVVVWTESSVSSRWVRTEANEGLKREILVPVSLEPVRLPLEFRRVQSADLIGWRPGAPHVGFDEFVGAVQLLIKSDDDGPPPGDGVEAVLNDARELARNEQWEQVLSLLNRHADQITETRLAAAAGKLAARARRMLAAERVYEEAERAFTDGNWTRSLALLDQVDDLDPGRPAVSSLRSAAERHRDDAMVAEHRKLARAAIYRRDFDEAETRLRWILARRPSDVDAAASLRRVLLLKKAARVYRRLTEKLDSGRWLAVAGAVAASVLVGVVAAALIMDSEERGCEAIVDDFDDELDRDVWTVLNEDTSRMRTSDGALVIDTAGRDFWRDGPTPVNLVLRPVSGRHWTVRAEIEADLRGGYQQAGVLAYRDDDNYAKVGIAAEPSSTRLRFFYLEDNGRIPELRPEVNDEALAADFPSRYWVRLVRNGDDLTASVSMDGRTWQAFDRTGDVSVLGEVRVGLFAFHSGSIEPIAARFHNFTLVQGSDDCA